mmetsp:Transcript_22270/g.71170  ORF Transcript_22270/g.71170 Transcript_22270/m.71170 type:complete len:207 (+) Transcript_22270:393-1013(+)
MVLLPKRGPGLFGVFHRSTGVVQSDVPFASRGKPALDLRFVALFHPQVVGDFLDCLRPIRVRHHHPPIAGILSPARSARNMPCIAHHELKVVVAVDCRAQVLVILAKLLARDHAILLDHVELGEELPESLCRRDACLLGCEARIVSCFQIRGGHYAIPIPIQAVEGLIDERNPHGVERATEASHELIEADFAAAVLVERCEHLIEL